MGSEGGDTGLLGARGGGGGCTGRRTIQSFSRLSQGGAGDAEAARLNGPHDLARQICIMPFSMHPTCQFQENELLSVLPRQGCRQQTEHGASAPVEYDETRC